MSVTALFLVLVGGGLVSGGAANGSVYRRVEVGRPLSFRAGAGLRKVYRFETLERRILSGMGRQVIQAGRRAVAALVARNLVCCKFFGFIKYIDRADRTRAVLPSEVQDIDVGKDDDLHSATWGGGGWGDPSASNPELACKECGVV